VLWEEAAAAWLVYSQPVAWVAARARRPVGVRVPHSEVGSDSSSAASRVHRSSTGCTERVGCRETKRGVVLIALESAGIMAFFLTVQYVEVANRRPLGYSQAPLLRTQRRAFLHKLYLAGLILWVPLLLGALSEPTWRYLPGVYIFVSSVLRLPELTAGFAAMARAHRTS